MRKNGKEVEEKICVERFLHWYNKQHNRDYVYKRTEDHSTELKGKLRWDFVVYERANPQEWIGIEVKELQFLRETSKRFTFWERLCSDLTKDLPGKGIQGEFEISFPPVLGLAKKERPRLLEILSQVLIGKQTGWEVGKSKDIGPDVWSEFPSWPKQRSNVDEWNVWGRDRPCNLEITKVSDSGCRVSVVTSPLITGDVVEEDKKAFDEVFRLKNNGLIQADRQLELAKEKGARKTILLLAGIGVDEGLTKNSVQNLDHQLVSHIDCIYLVDMGNGHSVAKMYPSQWSLKGGEL